MPAPGPIGRPGWTEYHATVVQTEFEVATMERAFGAEVLAAAAAMLGRSGYRTSADLDAIMVGLRARMR